MNKMKAIIKQFFLHGVGQRFIPFFCPLVLYKFLLIDIYEIIKLIFSDMLYSIRSQLKDILKK
jgi:hypothetical protein